MKNRKTIRKAWNKQNKVKDWYEYLARESTAIYDNGGKSIDRITVVFLETKQGSMYECVGACLTGNMFYQHTTCQRGRHLGKKISFDELTPELKSNIIEEYKYEYEQIY